MNLRTYCFTSWLSLFCQNVITTWRFIPLQCCNSNFSLKNAGLRIWWLGCMYFYQPNITDPMNTQYLREVILQLIQNVVGIWKQINILILYKVTFRLITLLKFIYTSVWVSNFIVLYSSLYLNVFCPSVIFCECPATCQFLKLFCLLLYIYWVSRPILRQLTSAQLMKCC